MQIKCTALNDRQINFRRVLGKKKNWCFKICDNLKIFCIDLDSRRKEIISETAEQIISWDSAVCCWWHPKLMTKACHQTFPERVPNKFLPTHVWWLLASKGCFGLSDFTRPRLLDLVRQADQANCSPKVLKPVDLMVTNYITMDMQIGVLFQVFWYLLCMKGMTETTEVEKSKTKINQKMDMEIHFHAAVRISHFVLEKF